MRRIPVSGVAQGDIRLSPEVAHYLTRVLRLREGDAFVAFDSETGKEADASMLPGSGTATVVRMGPPRAGSLPATRSIVWVQGLPKAEKCDAVVRDATELGATRIVVAVSRRAVVRLDAGRAQERAERWARVARDAARQSGRSDTPRIDPPCSWQDALALVDDAHARFCLWENARDPLAPPLFVALAGNAPLAFACGPEGGLEESEVAFAREHGWTVVSLGRRILRTETVAAAVLGAVEIASHASRT